MRALLTITLNELRLIFQDRGIWLNLILIPLVISFAVGLANGALGEPDDGTPTDIRLRVDVFDNDGGALVAPFLADIRANNTHILLCPMDNDAEDACALGDTPLTPERAQTRLEENESLALIEIPTDFTGALERGEAVSVVYRANEDASAPTYILQAVDAAAERLNGVNAAGRVALAIADETRFLEFADDADRAAFADSARNAAAELWDRNPVTVAYQLGASAPVETAAVDPGQGGFSQSIPGIASMYVMFAVFPGVSAFILDHKIGTLQRLITMPVSRVQVLGGKLLARFVIGMIQYAVVFAFGALLGVRYGSDPLALILLMVVYVLCITALMTLFTTLLRSQGQAEGITLFVSLTLAPLGGAWWSLDIVPEVMRQVGHLSPVAWVMDGYHELIFFGGSLINILPMVGVLAAMTALFFGVAVTRLRVE